MGTSTIKTGLRIAEISSSLFTWNASNHWWVCPKNDAETAAGMSNITTYFATGGSGAGGRMFGSSLSGTGDLIVSGWYVNNATPVSSTDKWKCYAIGY